MNNRLSKVNMNIISYNFNKFRKVKIFTLNKKYFLQMKILPHVKSFWLLILFLPSIINFYLIKTEKEECQPTTNEGTRSPHTLTHRMQSTKWQPKAPNWRTGSGKGLNHCLFVYSRGEVKFTTQLKTHFLARATVGTSLYVLLRQSVS